MAACTHPLTYSIMPSLKGLLMNKMATTATKLPLTASRVLLLSTAVFIFLSGSHAKESRKCYWCGPLAEQVHRSQRAPSCDNIENHVTICDPGYTHCAVVATSPPFVESRYCVKLYQDECYSLFCNSTKTWRMTCPCRGDLCNGRNSERENEAFSKLVKLVEKTNYVRIKRATVSTPNFIKSINNKVNNNMVAETNTNMISETIKDIAWMDNVTDDQALKDAPKEVVSTAQVNISDNPNIDIKAMTITSEHKNEVKESTEIMEINNVDKTTETGTILGGSISSLEDMKVINVATNLAIEDIRTETSTVGINNVDKTTEMGTTLRESISSLEDMKVSNVATNLAVEDFQIHTETSTVGINNVDKTTEMGTTLRGSISSLEDMKVSNVATNLAVENIRTEITMMEINNIDKNIEMSTTLGGSISSLEAMKVSTVATSLAVEELRTETSLEQKKAKITEKLPAAEALQQNTSPVEKSKDHMTTETILMTTAVEHTITTVLPTSSKNNTGIALRRQIPTLIAGIILNQYL